MVITGLTGRRPRRPEGHRIFEGLPVNRPNAVLTTSAVILVVVCFAHPLRRRMVSIAAGLTR